VLCNMSYGEYLITKSGLNKYQLHMRCHVPRRSGSVVAVVK
jgi:hypothetical protein